MVVPDKAPVDAKQPWAKRELVPPPGVDWARITEARTVRKMIGLMIIGGLLIVAQRVSAGPFEDGNAAYGRGDYATALKLWRPLAQQGNAIAQTSIAVLYYKGQGVAQDYQEAAKWLRFAAEQGIKEAQGALGTMFKTGQGVAQNYKEAAKWHRFAAEQGYAEAQSSLGVMYAFGQGVSQDHKEAVKWYRLAVARGNVDARSNLGVMYDKGWGVTRDNVRAHMWFNLAAASLSGDKGNIDTNERDRVASKMTPAQIERAQEMARKCQESKFKDCGW